MSVIYKSPRPNLSIECTGGANLGNCYNASYWRVTSRFPLKSDVLHELNKIGVLGFGQEFRILSTCDGTEQPAGFDEAPPVDVDDRTGEPTGKEPRAWNGALLTKPSKQVYYVYECEARCDSSD